MENKGQQFVLSAKVLQETLNYLASRPFAEVSMLIGKLSTEIAPQQPQIETPNEEAQKEAV